MSLKCKCLCGHEFEVPCSWAEWELAHSESSGMGESSIHVWEYDGQCPSEKCLKSYSITLKEFVDNDLDPIKQEIEFEGLEEVDGHCVRVVKMYDSGEI